MILITGGTGFVGQAVVRELLALGYRVRLLARKPVCASLFHGHPGLEIVTGDVLKPETLPPAMAGVKAVVHLVGIIKETSRVTFEEAHIEATRNLLAAARQAGVTRWVQMSAAGTRAEARSRYHITKWQAEDLVRQSGLDWTIFRPSLVYGDREDDRLLKLLRLALSWPLDVVPIYTFPLLNGGRALVQPVSRRDVAHCFARAVAKEASVGQTYELVGPTPLSWREMIFLVARVVGKKPIYEEIPLLMVFRVLLWLLALAAPFVAFWAWNDDRLNLVELELGAGLWVALLIALNRWTQLIVFSVAVVPLRLLGLALRAMTPRSLHFTEQLKMAEEDNVGDPQPAMKAFGYTPESFAQGVARVLG
jgi:uncharacterized protein YbjT (DUF2867 family)